MSGSQAPTGRRRRFGRITALVAAFAAALPAPLVLQGGPASAAGPCDAPVSVIACENSKTGTPSSDWDISGSGSSSLQGYATRISVQPGETVQFKIKSTVSSYTFDILRLGYYQGNGARKVAANLAPSASQPQSQPNCVVVPDSTGLIDCGNWAVSASWAVPATAVSGVYLAHLKGSGGAESHIVFVVRDDARQSDMLVQTSDETWQAYNKYGGNSLYTCSNSCPPGSPAAYKGASKVSYNRPFTTAVDSPGSWLMSAEYPMIRFLEANGYDVSYTTGVDLSTSAGATALSRHETFLSVGHDEYWSATQRANVEAARDNGMNLAFFSGNEVFWKTRFEASVDGSNTANRTLVTYKDTHYDAQVDPVAWTGTWQDPRFSPPGDGGKPQNALTGQLFQVNTGTTDIKVPEAYSKLRFWRNTQVASLAPGQTLTLAPNVGTLGYEWDVDADNGFRPAGAFRLSSTTSTTTEAFTDYGSTVKTPTTATHNMTLYRAGSGALVFGAGTVQWSWGLASPGITPDRTMQQATVNLFADMGSQPYALLSGLTTATASTDTSAPTSTITSPAGGTSVGDGSKITISGTASDTGGGVVAGVEVSTDGGQTWRMATGTTSWTYSWVVHGSPGVTIKSRAVDDTGNLESPGAGRSLDIGCTCSILGTGAVPATADSGSGGAVEVGVKFQSAESGLVTGVRFYKSSQNNGTHTGSLWSATGTRLASATFTGESSSGWQQVTFGTPVAINANTTYVVSYFAPNGHTAQDEQYFYAQPSPGPYGRAIVESPPLRALRNVNGTVNGVFQNSSTSTFPTQSTNARNYWVDVMFSRNSGPATVPGAPTSVVATPGNSSAQVMWNGPSDGGSAITSYTVTPYVGSTAQTPVTVTGNPPDNQVTVSGLTNGTAYTFRVTATNAVGTGPASSASNTVTPSTVSCVGCTIWPASTVPSLRDQGDPGSIELGVKFKSDVNGQVTGIRFYKDTLNIGTHVGSLWTTSGTKLASATFTNETATGWQQVNFAAPVTITAGTVYVASYFAPAGHYASDTFYFATGVDSGPLHALADGVSGGNGVYRYSSGSAFPTSTFNSENYYVDVVFSTGAPTAPSAPTDVTATAGSGSATVSWTVPASNGSPITSYTVTPYIGSTAQTPVTVTGNPPSSSTTVTGLTNGTAYTFRVTATNAIGTGPTSAPSNSVTPSSATAPAAPTGVSVTAGDASAVVSWTAPASNGSPITSYTVTPYVGATAQTSVTVTGAPPATTATVTGLTNGTAYTFTVRATNAVGTGPESSASSPVTPTSATVPAAPTNVTPTAGDSSAVVSWTAPADGGSAITSYTVTPYVGSTAQTAKTVTGSPPATSTTVTGLTNGTAYTFRVTATNAVGTGPASAASAPVTPTGPTAPAAPTDVTATAQSQGAVVSWSAPDNGGSPITSYTVTPYVGSTAQPTTTVSGSPPATTATVTGLTNGTSYTFRVTATNAVGTGPASAPSPAVVPSASSCAACTIWPSSATPVNAANADSNSVEVGVKFASDADGTITGIRFYKGAGNTGTHVGNLWSASGTNLASATFTNESASGWQQVSFATPVPITAGTTYVASYFAPAGQYAGDGGYFVTGVQSGPLRALADGVQGGNGVYRYGLTSSFPTETWNATNYWVDVVFAGGAATAPSAPTNVSATAGNASASVSWSAPTDGGSPITGYTITPYIGSTAQTPTAVNGNPPATTATVTGLTNGTAYTFGVAATNAVGTGPTSSASNSVTPIAPTAPTAPTNVTATAGNTTAVVTWSAPTDGGSPITSYTVTPYIGSTAQTPTTVNGNPPATTATVTGLTNGTAYTFRVSATNSVGTGPDSAGSNSVTPVAATCSECTLWSASASPTTGDAADTASVEVGVKFTSDVNGVVTGIRFWKSTANTGTHVGNLWSASGTNLATATFTGESASGWQQVTFANPVPVTAGTTYVASYFAPAGHYAADGGYFTAATDNSPLHALADGASGGNGVYRYGLSSSFPNQSFNATNYWVDVVLSTAPASAPAAPTGVTATAADTSAVVSWTAPAANGSGITSYTVTPYVGSTAQASTTVSGTPPLTTATVTGLTNGTAYTFRVSATNAVGTGPESAASNTVTPSATACTACTIWVSTATPKTAEVNDTAAVEVGVKFKSDVAGKITGVRFYKGAGNTGTHVGSLWTTSGTRLASATFTNETASGWQQVTFATPVSITAGTTYVASYFAPVGRYAGDSQSFNSAGVDRAPLHALKSSSSGGNGVYRYSGTSAFPNSSFQATNYWVDVVFSTN